MSNSINVIKTKLSYLIFVFIFFQNINAQKETDSTAIQLHFNWGNKPLELNKNYVSNNDTLQISLLKFYISAIKIQFSDGTDFEQTIANSYHLVDIENQNSLIIPLFKKDVNQIKKISFTIGVDSTASVSGALAGDLDPQKGMYWAWQSGYINMKIEGKSSNCKTRKNEFHFHIGGYLKPNYAMRTVEIPMNKLQNQNINLVMDLSKLFSEISLKETNSIMIPGKEAIKIADLAIKLFSIE